MEEDVQLVRLSNIEKKLEQQGRDLAGIAEAISRIAVQDERIGKLDGQVEDLWRKWDMICGPDGMLVSMKGFQASCPRGHIK